MKTAVRKTYTATRNACKLCTPLGAALAFQGIEGCVPLLHGSQGCSTYMRRYLISHFKEPVDIASSNFTEETAIFGGGANLKLAIENVARQYTPSMIGIATTCLSETIGDDVPMIIEDMENRTGLPELVHVATPSYTGTHMDGFHQAVRAVVDRFNPLSAAPSDSAQAAGSRITVNCLPGMLSNEDLRHIKEIIGLMDMDGILLPDYSERLDGSPWMDYQVIQKGGTPVSAIRKMHRASGSLELGRILAARQRSLSLGKAGRGGGLTAVGPSGQSAGNLLFSRFGVPCMGLGLPMGVRETDRFLQALELLSGRPVPELLSRERGRLIDAYVDCNKYLSGKRAVVYGEEDLVVGIAAFLSEIGVVPVLCASGGRSGFLRPVLEELLPRNVFDQIRVRDDVDFMDIEQEARECCPDFLMGSSKGYSTARKLKIPLVRVGFPIHDRVGGSRILHIGYRGAQRLMDDLVNTLLERRQETSDIGYAYM
ncbi:MAG: nitrogenase component 1 [Pseudomonadota bacterium]